MSQLSFFTAESVPPAVADLSGVLAASGQIVSVGTSGTQGARLSVVVDQLWRASALADMIREAGFARVKYDILSGGIVALHSGWRL